MPGPTAVIAVSRNGAALARTLALRLDNCVLYLDRRFLAAGDDAIPFDLPLRPLAHQVVGEYRRLVVFLPVGATVRLLAPCLQSKTRDPAVACVDDAGRFAVSLVSGHLGGADALAQQVADILGATPVITSASHAAGTLAVDLLGQEFGWRLEADPQTLTRASAAVVNGEPVGIYQEAGEGDWWPADQPLLDNIRVHPSLGDLAASDAVAGLVITDRAAPTGTNESYARYLAGKVVVVYYPRSLVVGIGCRRGSSLEELDALLTDTFYRYRLSLASLRCIATARIKLEEPGLVALAEKYGVPLLGYGETEVNRVFEGINQTLVSGARLPPTPSPVPYRLLGVWGVAEPAAILASGIGHLLIPKRKTDRATIAVARVCFDHNPADVLGGEDEPT